MQVTSVVSNGKQAARCVVRQHDQDLIMQQTLEPSMLTLMEFATPARSRRGLRTSDGDSRASLPRRIRYGAIWMRTAACQLRATCRAVVHMERCSRIAPLFPSAANLRKFVLTR